MAFLLSYWLQHLVPYEFREEITIGSVFFLAGLSLIIYYLLARNWEKKNTKE